MASSNYENVLNELHDLLVHNVIGDKQYNSRYNGFIAELDFQSWYEKNRVRSLIDGGMFIPTEKSNNPFLSAIYITSSDKPTDGYIEIYSKACVITPNLAGLFFIKYEPEFYETWNKSVLFHVWSNGVLAEKSFSIPPFEVYEFEPSSKSFNICTMTNILKYFTKSKEHLREATVPNEMKDTFISKLSKFKFEHILKLYLDRLFFDGYLNLTYTRGAPLDIDAFVYGKKGELCLLEIKEKDISKKEPQGFGMDLRRIESLNELTQLFKSRTCYVVRHINDQKERKFVDWRLIDFKDFKKHIENSPIITGGTGMRSKNSYNPTQVCAFENFKKLD
jgi:hypothetical protein